MSVNINEAKRRPEEQELEYIERVLTLLFGEVINIKEILQTMGLDIAGLEADEATLAQVIPFLVNENQQLHKQLGEDEAALQTKVTELEAAVAGEHASEEAKAAVEAELATAKGELTQVEAIKAKLDPVAAEGAKLLPDSGTGGGDEGAGGGSPAATEPTQPVYEATGTTPDSRFTASGFQKANGTGAVVYYFSEDTPNQTTEAKGGEVEGYVQFTGAVEPIPAG